MRDLELVARMLCGRALVDSRALRSRRLGPNDRERLVDATIAAGDLALRVWAPSMATLADIRAVARQTKRQYGLRLLVVDYIGIVRPSADERKLQPHERISAVSAGLKALAKELDMPVIACCQLNREAGDGEPKLSHLRDSGAIEQDADIVLLLDHEQAEVNETDWRPCKLIVAKHRHGETGDVRLRWHPRETRFSDGQ